MEPIALQSTPSKLNWSIDRAAGAQRLRYAREMIAKGEADQRTAPHRATCADHIHPRIAKTKMACAAKPIKNTSVRTTGIPNV